MSLMILKILNPLIIVAEVPKETELVVAVRAIPIAVPMDNGKIK